MGYKKKQDTEILVFEFKETIIRFWYYGDFEIWNSYTNKILEKFNICELLKISSGITIECACIYNNSSILFILKDPSLLFKVYKFELESRSLNLEIEHNVNI